MRARVVASLLGCLVLLTLTTVVSPQPQRPVPTVGVLNYAAPHDVRVVQFIEAFRELGYVEERNLTLVQRHADGILDRLPGSPPNWSRPKSTSSSRWDLQCGRLNGDDRHPDHYRV